MSSPLAWLRLPQSCVAVGGSFHPILLLLFFFHLCQTYILHPSLKALPAYSFFLAPCILHGLCPQEIVNMSNSLSVTVSSMSSPGLTQSSDFIAWCESHSVVSDSLRPQWNSPSQNTGLSSLSLIQRIFPTQELNPGLPHYRWILYQLSHKENLYPFGFWVKF